MNIFVIFVIVYTLATILYYVAMIAIDLNTKPKSDASEELNIEASDDSGITPRIVGEDSETGAIHFSSPFDLFSNSPNEGIAEAEDEYGSHAYTDSPDSSAEDRGDEMKGNPGSTEASENSSSEVTVEDGQHESIEEPDDHQNVTEENHVSSEPSTEVPEEESEESSGIVMEDYSEDTDNSSDPLPVAEPKRMWNPAALTPSYDVSKVIEPFPSSEAVEHAASINEALDSIAVTSEVMNSQEFAEQLRHGANTKFETTNII